MFDRDVLQDGDFINAWNVVCGELNGFEYDWNGDFFRKPAR
jgi:hypothetical protein